jgi:hypothetical protein
MYKYQNKKTGKIEEFKKPIDRKLKQEYRLISFVGNTMIKSNEVEKKDIKNNK